MVELLPKDEPGQEEGSSPAATGVSASVFDVRSWTSASVTFSATSWGTALTVELKWAHSRSGPWYSFPSSIVATADATFVGVGLHGIPYIAMDVTTLDAAATGLMCGVWGQA